MHLLVLIGLAAALPTDSIAQDYGLEKRQVLEQDYGLEKRQAPPAPVDEELECEEVIVFPPDQWDCEQVSSLNEVDLNEFECWEETDYSDFDCEEDPSDWDCEDITPTVNNPSTTTSNLPTDQNGQAVPSPPAQVSGTATTTAAVISGAEGFYGTLVGAVAGLLLL